jgi:hypothetical protein
LQEDCLADRKQECSSASMRYELNEGYQAIG